MDTFSDFKRIFKYALNHKEITECPAGSLSIDDILNTVNYGFQISTDAVKGPSCVNSTREVVDSISN